MRPACEDNVHYQRRSVRDSAAQEVVAQPLPPFFVLQEPNFGGGFAVKGHTAATQQKQDWRPHFCSVARPDANGAFRRLAVLRCCVLLCMRSYI